MKKIILSTIILLMSFCGFSQIYRIKHETVHTKISTLEVESYFINEGGELRECDLILNEVILYDNRLELNPYNKLFPKKYTLKNMEYNLGEKYEAGKFILYRAEIEMWSKKYNKFVTLYYSEKDSCNYLEVENKKHIDIFKIK